LVVPILQEPLMLGGAAGYALAALMTAAELSPAWRIALVTPMVVLFAWSVVPHLLPAP
jgi:hypothetical protein